MLPTRFWAETVWTDFKADDVGDIIAVLPVAAVEQHGPHLPLGVDYFLMQADIGARGGAPARGFAGAVSARSGRRRVRRAYGFPRHAFAFGRDVDTRLD